jgi:FkbM family methyltransferase
LFKLLPQHDDIYPRIASETDHARFVFLAHKDAEITDKFVKRLSRAFSTHGLRCEDYCHMLPRQHFPDFLGLNRVCDVLLDSIDWSGGKTTLEAISCGLPVVTLPGKMMRGRHAFSMLRIMGIDATVAKDKADFVRIAAGLCRNRAYHAKIRRQINDNKTKLYADKACIRALEAFYRTVIRTPQPKRIRKDGGAFLVRSADKQYHGVPFWDAVAENLWEADSFRVIRRYCSADRCCIDLGAWIGPTALHAANFARHVYAVEPDRRAAAQLRDNLALNPHLSSKTTLFEGCISNHSGPVCIGTRTDFGDSETSMLLGGEAKKDVVRALRFADFLDAYRIEDCSFIKMDIEGAERLVLPDMAGYLQQASPTLFISLHPHLFGESAERDMRRIFAILSTCYHHFYLPSGDRIEAPDLAAGTFLEIVAVRQKR